MTEIWKRDWSLTVGSISINPSRGVALDVSFDVEKDLTNKPNTARISVYNFSESRRTSMSIGDEVDLRAGYVDMTSTIYLGEVRRVFSGRQGVDIITEIDSRDRGDTYRNATLDRSWPEGTAVTTVISALIDALGIGQGNFSQYRSDFTLSSNSLPTYQEGFTVSGRVHRSMGNVCRSCGLRFSIQNGNIQFRRAGQPTETRAIVLSPDTGLIGSPKRDVGGNHQRANTPMVVNAQSFLLPGVYPGRVISLQSSVISGNFRAKRVKYTGETYGVQWNCDITMEEY